MVTIYYNKCPVCKATFRTRLRENILQLGPETRICRCGTLYASGRHEWANLTRSQKRDYFISEGAVGILLVGAVIGGMMGLNGVAGKPIHFSWTDGALGASIGILIALPPVAVLWMGKAIKVRLSLRRCPPTPTPAATHN